MDAEQLYGMVETHEDWEVFIIDTVRKEKMDPWDIDVGVLAEKCLERIRQMKVFDFRVPGKVVLSAAILLRMKSDSVVLRNTREIIEEYMEQYAEDFDKGEDRPPPEFPMLEPMLIRAPKSKVTIDDLLVSLRKVLKEKERKAIRREEERIEPFKLVIPEYNIGEAIEKVMKKIRDMVSGKPFITFFGLLKKKSKKEIARTIIPVLHLSNDGLISLEQEKMFGPIKIFVNKDAKGQETS